MEYYKILVVEDNDYKYRHTEKFLRFAAINLNIDGSKLTMYKECPTHAVSVENASLEISTLPSDFIHLVSSIFRK